MKIKKIVTLVLVLLIVAAGSIVTNEIKAAKSAVSYQVRAQASDSFVESMGINTKFGFCPGRLCANYSKVKTLLAQLGIRYIRDIPYIEPWRIRTDLYEDYGIRMLVGVERSRGQPLTSENISAQLDIIKLWGKMIVGIVGVNEYDYPGGNSCEENPKSCDPDWSEISWSKNYFQFQQRLYDRVKTEPELRHLPVVMGPMGYLSSLEQLEELGGSCDKGNDHTYPSSYGKPSQVSGREKGKQFISIDELVAKVQQVCPGKKLWITEIGYIEKDGLPSNKELVTRQAKAKYLPRIYANHYLQEQIEKTFLFELLSAVPTEPTRFGIINTNLQPTPAYYAIRNLISLLGEATWNKQKQSWKYPNFEASSLKYTLEGDRTDLKHLLLQKSDGTFYLLIWQEVYVYDVQTGKDLVNRDRIIDLKLKGSTIEKANKYLLYNQSDPAAELVPLKTWTNVSSLSLRVPDHILVLEFMLKD